MVESVRKDIECTYGTLKGWWLFHKNWNNLSQPVHTIKNVFPSCCMLHIIQLNSDGYLDSAASDTHTYNTDYQYSHQKKTLVKYDHPN